MVSKIIINLNFSIVHKCSNNPKKPQNLVLIIIDLSNWKTHLITFCDF